MKVKNVNPLEQHVEKIVVAVAAAAALYLGYSAYSDATSVDGPGGPVTAANVEKTVNAAVARLQDSLDKNGTMKIKLQDKDWVGEFKQQELQPLGSNLLAGVAPGAMPKNPVINPSRDSKNPPPTEFPVAAPGVVAPINVLAKAQRATVVDIVPPAPGAAAVTPAVETPRHDQQWVEVSATFPMLEQVGQITGASLTDKREALPPGAQRLTFYRVDVERQERHAGGWSEWTPVAEPKNQNLPTVDLSRFDEATKSTKIREALDQLDQRAGEILQPVLPFQVIEGAVSSPADAIAAAAALTPEQIRQREALKQEIINRQRAAAGVNQPPAGRPGTYTPPAGIRGGAVPDRDRQPAFVPYGGGGAAVPDRDRQPAFVPYGGGGGAVRTPPAVVLPTVPPGGDPGQIPPAATPPGQSPNAQALRSQDEVKVWFWDTTVKPGAEYRYRMRVRIYNPIYQWPQDYRVKNEAERNQQWLTSQWAMTTSTVQTQANQHYFLVQSMDKIGRATVRIYQYVDGRWVKEEVTLSPGQPVQTSHRIEGTTRTIAMDTGCVLVDVASDTRQNETRAVLLDTAGQLIVRDTRSDGDDPRKAELEKLIKAAIMPAPTPGVAPTPTPTPTPVPPGGVRPTPGGPGTPGGAPLRLVPPPPVAR